MRIYAPTAAEKATFRRAAQAPVIDWMRDNTKIENKWIDMLLEEVARAEKKQGL